MLNKIEMKRIFFFIITLDLNLIFFYNKKYQKKKKISLTLYKFN